jgi:hypothetical protein
MSIFKTSRNLLPDELDVLLRKSMKCAMLSRGINEEELAAELTKRLGLTEHPFKPSLINAWKAETKHRWHLPGYLIPIICEILGDDTIQRVVMSEKLRRNVELGESTPRIVSLLRSALAQATERKNGEGRKKPQRRSKR